MGLIAYKDGNYAAARASYEECLTIYRRLGHQIGISEALAHLGHALIQQREYAGARRLFEESLSLERRLENLPLLSRGLEGLAAVAAGQRQFLRAVQLWGAEQGMRDALGIPLAPGSKPGHEEKFAAALASLGEAAFTAAWDAGRAMTPDGAVEYALSQD